MGSQGPLSESNSLSTLGLPDITISQPVVESLPSKRESMPRKPRVFIEGGIYHVYCRASRGEAVFADDTEASEFRGTLRRIKERDGLVFFAWSLMSNHYLCAAAHK